MLKRLLATLFAVALIFGLAACGKVDKSANASSGRPCTEVQKDLDQAKANKTEQAGTPAESKAAKAVKKLEAELKSCKDASSTTTSTSTPPDDGQAGVADSDGALVSLPLVDDNGTIIRGDSTSDPRTPASYDAAKQQGPLVTWADAERVLGGLPWYVEALNARKSKTGFDWTDVQKWATADDVDPRVIQVFNLEISDQEARDAVRELVGNDADRLPIARHMTCIVNTRGFGHETVQDFADCREMVRVTLAPIVYNEKGEPVGLRGNTGIFVDCFNIWWIPRQVVKHGPPPQEAPPTTPTAPPTMPPAPPTTGLTPKDPNQEPSRRGNVPPQVQGPAPSVSEPASPPAGGSPPASYVPPAPPASAVVPPSTRPSAPPAPSTTLPPANDPEVSLPPVTGDPGRP